MKGQSESFKEVLQHSVYLSVVQFDLGLHAGLRAGFCL